MGAGTVTQTDFGYTGRGRTPRSPALDTAESGRAGLDGLQGPLYDAALGRITRPDTIIPNAADPQSWNRYTYVANNPMRFVDPTGHRVACGVMGEACEHGSLASITKGHDRSREEDGGPMGPTVSGAAGTGSYPISDDALEQLASLMPLGPTTIHLPLIMQDWYLQHTISPVFGGGSLSVSPNSLGYDGSRISVDGYISRIQGTFDFATEQVSLKGSYVYGAKLSAEAVGGQFGWQGNGKLRSSVGTYEFMDQLSVKIEIHPNRMLAIGALVVAAPIVISEPWTAPIIYGGCKVAQLCP